MGQSKGLGRSVIYGITIAPLLVTLGYYFVEHVPSREEYFLNLRFRTLGVIGKQIEAKLESVSSGLTYGRAVERIQQTPADGSPVRIPFKKYVGRVFPDLQAPEGQEGLKKPAADPGAIDPNIQFLQAADRIRFTISPSEQPWEDSLAHLIRPLTEDANFDDVLLAQLNGEVLFQRSDSTPKVRNVSSLLKKPDAKDSGALQVFHRLHSEGAGSDTDLLRDIDLDGSGYRLLAQPLTIRVPRSSRGSVNELLLCGLVRSDVVRREAMHVPPKYLLWVIVPLFAALLSGPLLKLILLRRTGRFETHDMPLLVLFSCLAMAMLTVVLLAYHLSEWNAQRLEMGSKDFADRLTGQVLECFSRGRAAIKEVDAFAGKLDSADTAPHKAMNRTRIWSWTSLVTQAPAVTKTPLEFLYWTSPDGFQIEKWTPLETNTPFYPQQSSAHFEQAVGNNYWRARDDPGSPFTAELLVSPTTSSPIAVLTMPSKRKTTFTLDRQAIDPSAPAELAPAFVSVVETPRNLLSPVIPPATGFALVQRDGSVIYHSDHERILNENLFRETEDSRELRDAVATQSAKPVEGRYRGNNVAFYVRPIDEVFGIPWTIVVFREIEPWQMQVWQVGLDVLLLYLLLWTFPVLVAGAALLYAKWRKRPSWYACRLSVLRYFWPQNRAGAAYRAIAGFEFALVAVFVSFLAWFGKWPNGVAGTVLLVSALLLPAAALAVWIRQLGRVAPGSSDATAPPQVELSPKLRTVYVAALCLTLMSSSVLPVTGLFYLAFRMESEIDVRHWQGDLADRVLKHRAETEAEIRQPERLSADAVTIALSLALPAPGDPHCDNERLYESWAKTTIRCEPGVPAPTGVPVWSKALRLLRMQVFGLDAGTVAVGDFGSVKRSGVAQPMLSISRPGLPDVVVRSTLWNLTMIPPSASWWALAAILLIAGCAWVWSAASRLFLFDFHEIPLRVLQHLQAADLNNPILVLGLPRSGKDGAVRAFIDRVVVAEQTTGVEAGERESEAVRARVDLKSDKLDEAWLNGVVKALALEEFFSLPAVEIRKIEAAREEADAADASCEIDSATPLAAAAAAGGGDRGGAAATGAPPAQIATPDTRRSLPDYVHVTNLDAALYDRVRRDSVMRLLDALVRAHAAGRLKLVVTSVVDPMSHFDIIFPDQSEEVDSSQLPETEFGRWAHVFLHFERVLVDESQSEMQAAEEACKKGCWGSDLWEECRHHRSLRRTGQSMKEAIERRPRKDEDAPDHERLVDELYEKAFALYELLWSACTRPEKLLLVQLAQTGLVNPTCKSTFQELVRKRLIVLRPYPAVMNDSFTRFLQSAATSEQIRAWEKEAGESHWLTVRNVLIIMMAFAFLMIGVTQDHALQSISGILAAVVGGIGGAFKLVDTISSSLAKKAEGGLAKV